MTDERHAFDLAAAIADRHVIDWPRLERRGQSRQELLDTLRSIEKIHAAYARDRARPETGRATPVSRIGWIARVLLALAAAQLALALAGLAAGSDLSSPVPAVAGSSLMIAYGAAALWLFVGGSKDARAASLGGFYLLIASAFCRRFLGVADDLGLAALARGLFPEVFLAGFLWDFIYRFPRIVHFGRVEGICRAGRRLSMLVGGTLFVANAAVAYDVGPEVLAWLARSHASGTYWALLLTPMILAVPVAALRFRQAQHDERGRVRLFVGVLVITLAPVIAEILIEIAVPSVRRFLNDTGLRATLTPAFVVPLLLLPVLTAYAIVVERVLNVTVVVGRALQYLFARGTLLVLTTLPLIALLALGYQQRDQRLADLLAGGRGWAAAGLALLGVTLWATRSRARAAIDRRFMRVTADLSAELPLLVARLRVSRSVSEIVEHFESHLQRVTGATTTVLLVTSDRPLTPLRKSMPGLPVGSALESLVGSDPSPLLLRADNPGSLVDLLPSDERAWLAASGTALLVPMVGSNDRYLGVVALGPKSSGSAFDREELSFVSAAAAAAALAMEPHLQQATPGGPALEDEPALECPACGVLVQTTTADQCDCGARLRTAPLPMVLNGKFQVHRRLGSGGMGVVYLARDLQLDRSVALKTLPMLSGDAAERLGNEARVMASVVHPNLATIFGVERWRATPILVVEYFEAGTLAARLDRGPLPVAEALRLGWMLAGALEHLHAAGVLHRDVKPSNVAFAVDGSPKLLDFGIASVAGAVARQATMGDGAVGPSLLGTPLYLSPERLSGAAPDEAADLWSLCLLIYESIAGTHPFRAPSVPLVVENIQRRPVPDLRKPAPGCPAAVAIELGRCLSRDPAQRPSTAAALRERLEQLRPAL